MVWDLKGKLDSVTIMTPVDMATACNYDYCMLQKNINIVNYIDDNSIYNS